MAISRKNKAVAMDMQKLCDLAEFRYQMRRFISFSESVCDQAGVSAQQYQLLQVVATLPDGRAASISYIAERMVIRHNSAVELVDRAERAGLVRRVVDGSDHRRSLVEIAGRGNELLAELVPTHVSEIRTAGGELLESLQQLMGNKASSLRRGQNDESR